MRNRADRNQAPLYPLPAFHVRMPERNVGEDGELARDLALVMREPSGITDRTGSIDTDFSLSGSISSLRAAVRNSRSRTLLGSRRPSFSAKSERIDEKFPSAR